MAKQKAKKHAHKAGESAPVAPRNKKDNTLLWVVGAIILVIVIVLLIRSAKEAQIPSAPPGTTPPATETKTPPKTESELSGMEVMDYCKEEAAIGAKPQFCEKTEGGVKVLITHNGAGVLDGLRYYVLDEDKNVLSEGTLSQGMAGATLEGNTLVPVEKTYDVPVSDIAAKNIEIRAVTKVDETGAVAAGGKLVECRNQVAFQPLKLCI